jgi:hypothetical protein
VISRSGIALGDEAVVKVIGPAEAVSIVVSDPDGNGWDVGEPGFGVGSVELALRELSGKDVYVTSVAWILYDATGLAVAGGTQPVDEAVAAGGTASLYLDVALTEGEADQVDDAGSTADDYAGAGTLAFSVAGRDGASGLAVVSVEGCAHVTVGAE